jgi:endonuclease/exonuclease/phosphatase family metal-dependent hydrolase
VNAAASEPEADPMLRVAQLNAGSLLEPEWNRRRHEILAWFDRLQPDVICLQEVWEDGTHANTAGWLVEHASADWHWCFGGYPFPQEVWPDETMRFGSAILSRWPIEQHELLPLPVDDSDAADLNANYKLQFDLLHARTAGVDVFSTHLAPPPMQAYHRLRQVLFIDDRIRDRVDPASTLPPILCGDFNAEPESDEMRFLTATAAVEGRTVYFQDAWKVAGPIGDPGWTQDPAGNPIYASMGLPRKRIDFVLVGDPFGRKGAGLVQHCELAFHEPITGIVASDHYGLVADITWPARP